MTDHSTHNHWRPKSYPAQTCNECASRDGSTLSSPVPEEQEPIPTPDTIHAVTDSSAVVEGRTLIICLDGTGDKFDNDNSNVVNFVACLKKDDPRQITYYQSGIGTYDGQGMKNGMSAVVDMAVGSGLGVHVKDAYRFLMETYREGDRICLLGFSRGSYTVRCLAGMLHKVGLLPAHNSAQVSFAYKFYKDDTPEGWRMSADFKRTFCTAVTVYFVGVWDCVASVGFIPRKLPFSKSPTGMIHYFRHAMALDEHRAKFKICQWQHADPAAKSKEMLKTPGERLKEQTDISNAKIKSAFISCFGSKKHAEDPEDDDTKVSNDEKDGLGELGESFKPRKRADTDLSLRSKILEKKHDQERLEKLFEADDHSMHEHIETDVLEVWFAGCHADVGGGAVANEERHMLSRIPLRWMIRQTFTTNTGILFSTAALAETGLDLHTLYPVYKETRAPFVGPSPDVFEHYQAGALPPLSRRSTALGVERKRSVKENGSLLNGNGHASWRKASVASTNSAVSPTLPSKRWTAPDSSSNPYSSPNISSPPHAHSKSKDDVDPRLALLPEQVEDHFDSLAPLNDMLTVAKAWWILEFWPVKVRYQQKVKEQGGSIGNPTSAGVWEKKVRLNMGRYRAIRETEPKMHWTVQKRMAEWTGEELIVKEDEKGAKKKPVSSKPEKYQLRNPVDSAAVWGIAS